MAKINISLNNDFLKKLDEYSGRQDKTRSGFIREAVESYIAGIEMDKKLEERKKKIRQARYFFRELAKKNKDWDGVKEINKYRDRS